MGFTGVRSHQIENSEVKRDDLNISESGQAVITKIISGTGITIDSSTGVDSGTGDVTISASGGGSSAGDYSSKEVVYQTLLEHSSYLNIDYDIFTSDSMTKAGSPLPAYNSTETNYSGLAGSIISKQIFTGATTTYYNFFIHGIYDTVVAPTAEYSINGSTWTSATLDTNINVSGGFTELHIRLTFNGTGKIYSFGVQYESGNSSAATDTRLYETLDVVSNQSAPYLINIPNNGRYTKNGKSLEVYLNRARLVNGVDFTETNNTSITMNLDLVTNDKLVFIEKFGYLDGSDQWLVEHNSNGLHILTDSVTGLKYRLTVENGNLSLVEQ